MPYVAFSIGLRMLAMGLCCLLAGCGDRPSARDLGQSLGENVTDFAQGVGTGVDHQLLIKVELTPTAEETGLTHTVGKQGTNLSEKGISIYFVSKDSVDGILVAKALNSDGIEIGRAKTPVSFEADDAKYVRFDFPAETDRQSVARYSIDFRPAPPEPEQTTPTVKEESNE